MKYIDADKLIAEIERLSAEHSSRYGMDEAAIVLDKLEDFISTLQQEQPETKEQSSHLEHWLAFFGCPEENIEKCATQIAQGYGAIRYLEGVQHGAEAVNELAQQEQPEVIGGVVHHSLRAHWIVTDQKQLATALKAFPEGTEVELFIFARKEDIVI